MSLGTAALAGYKRAEWLIKSQLPAEVEKQDEGISQSKNVFLIWLSHLQAHNTCRNAESLLYFTGTPIAKV